MGFLDLFKKHKKNVVLIVQCRLSSTRLPQKALLPLGNKTVLEWVLAAMKKVPADSYYLATDVESAVQLEPVAKKNKWEFFAGSKDDVLDRFCKVIEKSKADIVIRATADNPFLFYEAAAALVDEFNKREENATVDYITWTGLPHGSGVEMFKAASLLKARTMTDLPYDHEHVGPALYNHPENFNALFLKAPNRWYYPELRTTIDTPFDYRRAVNLVHAVSGKNVINEPYTTEQIINGMWNDYVRNPVLFVPCLKKGKGTGHLRRCLELCIKLHADIYIPENAELEQTDELVKQAEENGLENFQIVRKLDYAEEYAIVVTDLFCADDETINALGNRCSVVALDEGRTDNDFADYVFEIIPSESYGKKINYSDPSFIPLPEKVRSPDMLSGIHTAVVTLGGEDPAALSMPAAKALAANRIYVTVISSDAESLEKQIPQDYSKYIKIIPLVPDLKEKLHEYDLVVTHYGFTAFEAAGANCAVITLGTTELHQRLSQKFGFACIPSWSITEETFRTYLEDSRKLFHPVKENSRSVSEYITQLSKGRKILCPVCRKNPVHINPVAARTKERTFRRCSECGMLYQAWTIETDETKYNRSYFFEDYQKQYGKTYLEDFDSIKAQCIRRTNNIELIYHRHHSSVTPAVLDIGCAMGPFLDAANDAGWQVFGTDVSPDAVEYVQKNLHFPAACAPFPEFNAEKEFGITQFDAVTMWYVIEHFENLDSVLKEVSKILKKGGIFAFSTPSASGASGKYNTETFFSQSPSDHYTIWEPKKAASVLKKYGFEVIKTVSTGIHPERIPFVQKNKIKKNSLIYSIVKKISSVCFLGDTFEIYCRKVEDCK